jgi:hypothetical protein
MALPAEGGYKIAGLGHGDQLIKVKEIKDDILITASGDQAYRENGVLMAKGTKHPFRPSAEDLFNGKFKTEEKELTLAGFLTNPVTNHSSTNKLDTTATAMFAMLQAYPISWLTAILGTLSVILFFVTSSDSASMVADIIASGGSPNPTTGTRLFWGILEGVLASVLLLAGGLKALQTGAITLGLPFCLVVIGMCISLFHGLNRELNDDIPEKQLEHMQS